MGWSSAYLANFITEQNDTDHAVALERERIAAWLEAIEEWKLDRADWSHTSGYYVAEDIRNGDHWKDGN